MQLRGKKKWGLWAMPVRKKFWEQKLRYYL